MRFLSYLQTAAQIISQYKGHQPFSYYAKNFFGQHKKYGSSDRRHITKLCYSYYRLGKALPDLPVEERIIAGLFLCSPQPNELLQNLKPEWNEISTMVLEEKGSVVKGQPVEWGDFLREVFPWWEELDEWIVHQEFLSSFFVQPDLFLRLRPGHELTVQQKLQEANIPFEVITDTCLALPNASKADQAIDINKEAVIQDYNSQQVEKFLPSDLGKTIGERKVWDCCAGSGGKSIMAWDRLQPIDLTVSDVRESILKNLKKRFEEAGIGKYTSFTADLSDLISVLNIQNEPFDLIIADVPCTGSGTWGRTPEQLYFFAPEAVEQYSERQRKIVGRAIRQLKPGGYFLYITCSVFRKENEEVVNFIQSSTALQLQHMELLKGYNRKADTLFAALFKAPL